MNRFGKIMGAILCAQTCLFSFAILRAQIAPGKIESVTYANHLAYRLYTDKLEAIVVPDLGRVMSFKSIGGNNVLWNNPKPGNPYPNWGGDKVFIGPHFLWAVFGPVEWPPRPEWDGVPYKAEVLPEGQLQLTGAPWPDFDAFFVRTFSFDSDGSFVIKATLRRTGKSPLPLFVWPVTQVIKPDEIFIPLNPASVYHDAYFYFTSPIPNAVVPLTPQVARVTAVDNAMFKIGVDSTVASIAARFGKEVLIMATDKKNDQYPDGAQNAGFPVEIYNQGATGADHYVELELLSPVKWMRENDVIEHTVRWKMVEAAQQPISPSAALQLLQNKYDAKPHVQ